MQNKVVQAKVMMERVGPKMRLEVGAREHSTQGVSYGLMRKFPGAVLI